MPNNTPKNNLLAQALGKFALGVILVSLLVFIPAGSPDYWQGWLFIEVLFIPMFFAGATMLVRAPNLLKSRLDAREADGAQRKVVAASGLMFITGFVLAGLSHRLGWAMFPWWTSVIGAAVFLCTYALYAEVLRENAYLSRTIGVQEEQHLIDTGLYSFVRHPMYSATLILFLAIPFVLGSPFAVPVFLLYVPIIITRIKHEERVLVRDLAGYEEYRTRVRWRLIPGVW